MTTLTLTVERKNYEITFKDKQGKIKLPYSTKLPVTAKVAAVQHAAKATGVKVGDDVMIPDSESFTLTITAEDKTTTQEYTVTVEKGEAPSSEAAITALTLTVGSTDYEIDFTDRAYTLILPAGSTLPARVGVKTIALSSGATTDAGDQLSVTNNAVTITVTAENGTTTQEYTVRLAVSLSITSFTFEVPDNENMALDTADRKRIVGKIDQKAKKITFAQQSAYVYRDKLKATFEVSEEGAAVQVGNEDQTSGTTEQDFSSPVAYAVRAQDGTEITYTVTLLKSTLATISDDRFRTRLKAFVPAAFTGDQLDITHDDVVNQDGLLGVGNESPKLTSVKGIEFFTALTTLYCDYNALASLDVSKNTALVDLNCVYNALTSLDVSKNTALTELTCSINNLRSLDVSRNTALTTLNCHSNALTSLNVSGTTSLTTLICIANKLTSLNLSAHTSLTTLECRNNSLTSLDMTGMRSVAVDGLDIGKGTGTDLEPDNHLLETLRVNTALQDRAEIVAIKTARKAALTITTVNDAGEEQCANYTPATDGGNCN